MAIDPGDTNYVCSLDSEGKKKARDELNEIESDRANAVQTFRSWVLEQDLWLKSPVDFEFLLRFLRVRKFSQIGSRISLENFITSLTQTPEWFADLDPADEEIQKVYKTGFYVCPLKQDKDKRRIIIQRIGKLDESLLKNDSGVATAFRAVCLAANWLMYDENVQVHGIKYLNDWTNVTFQHATRIYKPEQIKKLFHFFQNSVPVRMKGLNVYNEPPFFDAIYAIVVPFMKEKTKNRLTIHGKNMTSVYKKMDQSVLPREYLPDDYAGPSAGSVKQIVDDMIADMMKPEFRNYIKELTSSKYRVDLSQKPKDTEPVATYRKLNID